MKIKIVSQDYLNELKSNLDRTYKEYSGNNKDLMAKTYKNNRFLETKYEIERFELDMSKEPVQMSDIDNVKTVFSKLMHLSNSEASDERLWAWFCLDPFWEYVQYRWNIDGRHNVNSVRNHFFFGSQPRRAYTRNAIARLWWIGKFTYDKERENPFELTEFVCERQDIIMHILERSISNNYEITKVIIQTMIDARNKGMTMNTNDIGEIMKYLNFLGATYILDFQTKEWIYDKTANIIKKIHINKAKE